ncbi:MAG: transpeptidase family protein [Bacteroidetes bacterium]|nr:transpeptidase family protein [Bacteroidota bacterium]
MANVKKSILIRIFISYGGIVLLASFIIWNILKIQFAEGKKWKSINDSLTIKYKVINAVRGNIYSDNSTLLATSVPIYEIRLDLTVVNSDTFKKYKYQLAQKLSEKFADKPLSKYLIELNKAKRNNNRYFLIKNKLSYLDIKEMKKWPIINKGRFKGGLIIEEENYRVMPFKNLLTRTLGYTIDGKQKLKVGIEGAYNTELAGVTGRRLVKKTAGGFIPINDENEVEPTDGKDIYTTIDINIQDIVNNSLLNGLIKHKAHHGCAILMEVKTGEIKAIANLTVKNDGTYSETFNYAIGESFEPGSTFKLVSALALIEKNKIKLDDSVLINYGEFKILDKVMYDAEESRFKKQSFEFAFEHSSNVGISTAIQKYFAENPKEFIDYLKKLNIQNRTGIELPGEAKPFVKDFKSKTWSKISLPWISIGYEIKLTPLQILNLYNAVANNGVMVKPFIVKAIGEKGEKIKIFNTQIINQKITDDETLKKIKHLLKNVVLTGTASVIKNSNIKISGKTGTARISDGKGYKENEYYSSFAGFFPEENPEYSVIVVVNNPKENGYYGGIVAAPIVKDLAEKIYGYKINSGKNLNDFITANSIKTLDFAAKKDVLKKFNNKYLKKKIIEETTNADWLYIPSDSTGNINAKPIKDVKNLMPDLTGMCLKDVLFILENKKVKVQVTGKGKVFWQSIKPGVNIGKGTILILKMQV